MVTERLRFGAVLGDDYLQGGFPGISPKKLDTAVLENGKSREGGVRGLVEGAALSISSRLWRRVCPPGIVLPRHSARHL